jgi:hypothetical protein
VPSYKLLPLGYQMASRLTSDQSTFQNVLKKILLRLAVEHPYHMLLHLLSLAHPSASGREAAATSLLNVRPSLLVVSAPLLCRSQQRPLHSAAPFMQDAHAVPHH